MSVRHMGCTLKHSSKCDLKKRKCYMYICMSYCCPIVVAILLLSHLITEYQMTSCCFYNLNIFSLLCVSDADESLPFYEVLVGVLSARHHYELRQAIRETWLGYLRDHPLFQHRSVGCSSNFSTCFFFFLSFLFQGEIHTEVIQPAAVSK